MTSPKTVSQRDGTARQPGAEREVIRLALVFRNLSRGYTADGKAEADVDQRVLMAAEAEYMNKLFRALDAISPPPLSLTQGQDYPTHCVERTREEAEADIASLIAGHVRLTSIESAARILLGLLEVRHG